MPVRMVSDGTGETMKLLDVDGYVLPCLPRNNLEAEFRSNKSWKAREDDVIICAYPKSGTHWLWEVISMLKNGKAEHIPDMKENYEVEFLAQKDFDAILSPRVLNSHLYFNQLPTDLVAKKCKIVFIDRNPKDVAVSFYNHHKKINVYEYEGSWNNYCYRFLDGLVDFGSWFEYMLDWETTIEQQKDYPIHVIHYEDMKKNGFEEIKRLAKFIGVDENLAFFKSIEDQCHFDTLKKGKDATELLTHWKDGTPGMYRKGTIGDWKNWFTVKQNEDFDRIFKEKMKKSRLTFRYSH